MGDCFILLIHLVDSAVRDVSHSGFMILVRCSSISIV